MKNNKHKIIILTLCASLLMSCSANTGSQNPASDENNTNTNVELNIKGISDELVEYEDNDFYTEWKNENPNYIELNGSSASLQGTGAKINKNIITINSPGTYVVSGKLENGQIIVDSNGDDAVRLVLNNTEISCLDNAPVYVKNSGKTIISLVEGTQNNITDGSTYASEDEDDAPNAALFSKDDLTINGSGSLTVKANYNNGIFGKDDLKITGGNINITSVDDGLLGRDLLAVRNSNITINSQGDGMKSTNDKDENKGNIVLEDGSYIITSGAKGIKSESSITVIGGKYTITSTDDSIHSNNSITISGGTLDITSEDDGIHADSEINIEGGTINVLKSYEGIESAAINISGGTIQIEASDDGINAAGKNNSQSTKGKPDQNSLASHENYILNISGGNIYIDASGDGLDANGSIYMSGGTVIINGPVSNGNGAIDYDQKFEISGGLLIAAGSSGMAQMPSEGSSQNSVSVKYSQIQKGGTSINIAANEKNIITFIPKKDYQTILVSSPDITLNSTYELYTGGTSTGTENYGLFTGGTYTNGAKLTDFKVSKSLLSITDTGEETTTGGFMPGQRGPGGNGGGIKPEMPEGERPEMLPRDFKGQKPEAPQNVPSETKDSTAPNKTDNTDKNLQNEPI